MALYESLTKESTPEEIAAAYKEFTGTTGGDTKAAQEEAVNYLTNLGIAAPTIQSAYQTYLSPAQTTSDADTSSYDLSTNIGQYQAMKTGDYDLITKALEANQQGDVYDRSFLQSALGKDAADKYWQSLKPAAGALTSVTPKATAEEIKNYFSGASGALPTMSQIQADMANYNVTEADIKAATGKTLEELNPTLTYYNGKQYDGNQVLNLARQLAAATDAGALKGGVFGEKGASIGFDFDQAKKVLGDNPNAVSQVLLDAAAGLIDKGITDLSQLKYGDITGQVNVRPEYDQNGVPTGRYVANWGGDYEGNNQQTRVLTPEEAAKVVSKEVGGADGSYTTYEPLTTTIGKGIYDSKGNLISNTGQLQVGETYTGPGGTQYKLTFDESGKPAFGTTGFATGNMGDVAGILAVLQFVPGAQPFVMAANAALAAANKNPLGALASVAGIPGVSDFVNPQLASALTTANQVSNAVNAANKGDLLALVNAGVGATGVGGAPLGETGLTVGDALRTANFAKAVSTGDPNAISRAISSIIGSQKTGTSGGITNRTYDETILDAGAKAFIDAKKAGASDVDAYAAANAVTTSATQKDLGEFQGLDQAIAANKAASTVAISNAEADTLQEAMALAQSRNPNATSFTYGGQQYNITPSNSVLNEAARADNLDRIKNEPTFSDAFAKARDLLGPNQTFEWNGKQYSTATFAENPALSGNVVPGATSTTAGGGRGSYAGFDSSAAAANVPTTTAKTTATDLNLPTDATYDAMGNLIGGSTVMGAPDTSTTVGKIADSFAKAANTFSGMVATYPASAVQAGSNLLSNTAGIIDLVAGKSTDIGNTLRDQSQNIDKFVQTLSDPQVKQQQQEIGSAVDKADGLWNKTKALADSAIKNPLGAANWVLTEAFEEVPGVGLALKAGSKLGTYGIALANDMIESGGSAYNDTYQAAIKQGMSEADARTAARNSSLASMAATGVTQGLVEGKMLSKVVGKETAGEFTEGAAQAGATQLALGQNLDVNKMLTQGIIEAAVGKGASSTADAMTTTNVVNNINTSIADVAKSGDMGSISNTIGSSVKSGLDSGVDVGSVAAAATGSALTSGVDLGHTVDSVVHSSINEDGSNAVEVATGVLDAAKSTGADINAASDALTNSLINSGVSASAAANIVADAKANAKSLVSAKAEAGTKTTADSNVKTTVDPNTGVTTQVKTDAKTDAKTTTTTDANTGVTTEVKSDPKTDSKTTTTTDSNTGVTTQVTSDAKTDAKTTTTTDSNTGVTTQVKTDAKTDAKTTVTTDANTNVTTKVESDANTKTTTTTDANTNTTTEVKVDSKTNVTTEVSVNADTNVTTETKTDPNTNTKTEVKTDPDTKTQITTVTDLTTGDVIDTKTTEIPDTWEPPSITPVPPVEPTVQTPKTATPTPKTPTPKKAIPQAAGLAGGVGAMLPSGFDMESVYLPSKETQKAIDPLQRVMDVQAELEKTAMMQQIDPRLLGLLQQRMTPDQQPGQPEQFNKDIGALSQLLGGQPTQAANENPYYSYGSEDSIDSILGGKAANYAEGGYVEPLKATGGAMALPLLAKSGGALGQYGGREDFKHGKHVAGEGDGQSDDIPAWLADGEFVFPADVVSALGNGSTKAGTDKLYEMMHSIRDRARSKGPKDLPPPALKSPLDYLKSHKRSK